MKPGSRADVALTTLFAAGGVAAIAFGLWQIYPPATWIFTGACAVFVSGIGQRPQPKTPEAAAK